MNKPVVMTLKVNGGREKSLRAKLIPRTLIVRTLTMKLLNIQSPTQITPIEIGNLKKISTLMELLSNHIHLLPHF